MRFPIPLLVLALLPGCLSDLRPDAPQPIRFYSAAPDTRIDEGPSVRVEAPLRLGRIRAADHLTSRMVWRVSSVEYGFYELSRWTEPPEAYLERALDQALHGSRNVPRSNDPGAATLDADLIGFEEDLSIDRRARVAVAFELTRGDEVLWGGTLTHSVPFSEDDRAAFASAARSALIEVVAQGANRVVDTLQAD